MISRRALLLSSAAAVTVPAAVRPEPSPVILSRLHHADVMGTIVLADHERFRYFYEPQAFSFGGDGIVRWLEPGDPTTWRKT